MLETLHIMIEMLQLWGSQLPVRLSHASRFLAKQVGLMILGLKWYEFFLKFFLYLGIRWHLVSRVPQKHEQFHLQDLQPGFWIFLILVQIWDFCSAASFLKQILLPRKCKKKLNDNSWKLKKLFFSPNVLRSEAVSKCNASGCDGCLNDKSWDRADNFAGLARLMNQPLRTLQHTTCFATSYF